MGSQLVTSFLVMDDIVSPGPLNSQFGRDTLITKVCQQLLVNFDPFIISEKSAGCC